MKKTWKLLSTLGYWVSGAVLVGYRGANWLQHNYFRTELMDYSWLCLGSG